MAAQPQAGTRHSILYPQVSRRSDDRHVIETIELTKVYKDFWGRSRVQALDGLNLEIRRGEVFGLLGPNGSGKTTAVRLVLGLLFPTRGVVRIFGSSPRRVDVKKLVGYMPEESHLYEYLNAEETLDFFARLFGLTRAERRRRTDALIEMVGLERARHRAIGEFSKGMARRIGLAQALVNDPDLLILDEPTTGLDPLGTREIKDLILTLKKRGKTILLCSHLLADVEEVCDRICILYGGKARALGRVSDLLTEQGRMEIRTPVLPEPVLAQVKSIIYAALSRPSSAAGSPAGAERPDLVEVSAPSRKLEEYFLSVVEDARRERLETAGATVGGPAADFLRGEPEGEKLVEDLVRAGQGEPAPQPAQVAPEPAEAIRTDRKLIEELVTGAPAPAQVQPGEQPDRGQAEPVSATEAGVRHDLIEGLIERSKETRKESDRADKAQPDTSSGTS